MLLLAGNHTVAGFQYSITKEVIWPLMELMESTSPSSYHAVLELDKKLHDLSAAINIYEDEQFNTTAASLEWNCILGATVRQASECRSSLRPTFGGFGHMRRCVDLVSDQFCCGCTAHSSPWRSFNTQETRSIRRIPNPYSLRKTLPLFLSGLPRGTWRKRQIRS